MTGVGLADQVLALELERLGARESEGGEETGDGSPADMRDTVDVLCEKPAGTPDNLPISTPD